METTYIVAAIPWLIEALWLWQWVPHHARRLKKQKELEAIFGPGFFDMTAPQSELYWLGRASQLVDAFPGSRLNG